MIAAARRCEYAELAVTTNFTFLTGASHPEEFARTAAHLGYTAIAIADTNTLAGIVRAHTAAKEVGIPIAIGSRIVFADPRTPNILVFPTTRAAYARLCQLLTLGRRRVPKGECHLTIDDIPDHADDMLALIMPPDDLNESFVSAVQSLSDIFDEDRLSLAFHFNYAGTDARRLERICSISRQVGLPIAATNDAHYHTPRRRPLHDVVTCIRNGCTIEQAGFRLNPNAEHHLKPPEEMARLFAHHPQAIRRSVEIAQRASQFSLDELKYEYPIEYCPSGKTPIEYLRDCTWKGAFKRYGPNLPRSVMEQINSELTLIDELRYEAYFLTCYEIVNFARSRGILCQGRGGAANSSVCYCLGITEVDPNRFSLLFARFVSRERNEPPDIDIDFEHERREEIIQHIYEKYGRDRAALTAEVICYRGRRAVREVGTAMGLSLDCVDTLAKNLDRWSEPPTEQRVREIGLNPHDPTIRQVIALSAELIGFPRHLSQHVGGFVITRSRLSDLVPIENAAMEDRTVIEWDKDDIDAMHMLKIDCLGLGMLTCIRKAFDFLDTPTTQRHSIASVLESQRENDPVYEMIQHADTVGVFQIESRAQMSMLPRLKPKEFYDLVIEVAIVRPGPIQGGMVHPYLRRRAGDEIIQYPSDDVRSVLGRTLGVPIFQEQAMRLAIVAAGFSPDQADALRQAMAAWKRSGNRIASFGDKLIAGMLANGYTPDFANRCFEQIKGFSQYGFPESHAASFALLVYVSAFLKRYHPAAFAAALINSQPMGFYRPAQIIRDAKEHGVVVRDIDVNASQWDCTLEHTSRCASITQRSAANEEPQQWGTSGPAIRLGMRMAKGLQQTVADRIADAVRSHGPFHSIESLWRASGVSTRALRCLARADAFASMNLNRQTALWQIKPLRDERLPLFDGCTDDESLGLDTLPPIAPQLQVLHDYQATGLSLKKHPIAFIRSKLDKKSAIQSAALRSESHYPQNTPITIAGIVIARQRPQTASGVVFVTLEDETGIANLVIWSNTYERYRRVIRLSQVFLVRGHVERQGEVIHVHAGHVESLDDWLPTLTTRSRDFH